MIERVKVSMEVEVERSTCDGCGAAETTKPEDVQHAQRHYDAKHLTCTSWSNRGTMHEVGGLVSWDQSLPDGGVRLNCAPVLCFTCRMVAWDAMRKVIPALQNLPAKVIA